MLTSPSPVTEAGSSDATRLAEQLARADISALALTEHCIAAARADATLHALTELDERVALAAARASDQRRARKASLGALDGLPVVVKANIAVRNCAQTAGLRFRADARANSDAFVVARLRAAGAVVLGISNMDEGALGAEGMNPWYGTIQNPLRAGYSPGGSSGGSAAAVAAGLCAAAIGTDTIGSVRIPAAFCGVVGLKPTRGLVSLAGVVPVNRRFDHVGPIARSARDLPALLAAIAVFDPACNVAFPHQLLAPGAARAPRRIAFAVGLDAQAVRPHVVEAYNRGIEAARRLGAQLVPLDLRAWDLARLRRAVLALCEQTMWTEHAARIAAQPEQFSDGLRAFIRYGGKLEAADIDAAERLTVTFAAQFAQSMVPYDALLLPTVPCTAFAHGERHPHSTADLTTIASVTGDPAITIPLPHPAGQLPAGLQLIGRTAGDYDLIQLAIDLEQELGRSG